MLLALLSITLLYLYFHPVEWSSCNLEDGLLGYFIDDFLL